MSAARLQALLGLADDELLQMLDSDPLAVITGEEDSRPEVHVLLALLADAEERVSPALLRRWLRPAGPAGRPLALPFPRDFAGFEDALGVLAERGYTIGGR